MSDREAVIRAVDERDYARLATLIVSGADMNTFRGGNNSINRYTALTAAVRNRDNLAVDMLIENGANLNIQLVSILQHLSNISDVNAFIISLTYFSPYHILQRVSIMIVSPILLGKKAYFILITCPHSKNLNI